MNTKFKLFLLLLFAVLTNTITAQKVFKSAVGLRFEMRDEIKNDLYAWPQTLLNYPVEFEGDITESQLYMKDNFTNAAVPFQLSEVKLQNGKLLSAKLNFITSLKSGGLFSYELTKRNNPTQAVDQKAIRIVENGNKIEVSNGDFQINIPKSAQIDGLQAPAPVIAIGNFKSWMGDNKLSSQNRKIKSVQTSLVEKGSLFAVYKVSYQLDNNGLYDVFVKMVLGYPFVIVEEKMTNISTEDHIQVDYVWNNFSPEYRFGTMWGRKSTSGLFWLPIDKPLNMNYTQEDPHWNGLGKIEDPAIEMVFRIIPFGGNGVREQVPLFSFWESGNEGRELGIFVYDHNKWDDHQYGLWQTTNNLAITFRYTDKVLYWKYPLTTGSRSTAISFFPTKKNDEEISVLKTKIAATNKLGNNSIIADEAAIRYTQLLHQQYGTLDLNKVKNWTLSYDISKKRSENPFTTRKKPQTADQFYQEVMKSDLIQYPIGVNFYCGVHSIRHRILHESFIQGYLDCYNELSTDQRKKVEALFMVSAYVNSQEDMNAIRFGIAGTPNMAADGWTVPAQIAFLFPEHPDAAEWRDFYKKEIELNALFYTRPAVNSYESKGGRWTESLSVYNWAYMRPTGFAQTSSLLSDGKNRWTFPQFAERGNWFVDMVTAPIYNPYAGRYDETGSKSAISDFIKRNTGKELTSEAGFERQYPAHGAHGNGITVRAYAPVWQLGNSMRYYDPITAEHLLWLADSKYEFEGKTGNTSWTDVARKLYPEKNNGTNPDLKSCKYTGHGVVLRAGVGKPDELSIHLNQVDKGPNYRWGNQGQGGAGSLYFYAGGSIYTGHENEANGDHSQNNTDGVTNFGVMKNGTYTNIGPNELTAPMFDLGEMQFAELLSSKEKDLYVWPEYVSRSILSVGTDYFILYDETGTNWRANNRFSWFNSKERTFPQIIFIGDVARSDHWSIGETEHSRGFYRDDEGSLMTLVTPKFDQVTPVGFELKKTVLLQNDPVFEAKKKTKSNKYPEGVVEINAPQSNDFIFRADDDIDFSNNKLSFIGKTGAIRFKKSGEISLALFYGTKISASKTTFVFSKNQLGWSAFVSASGEMSGKAKLLEPVVAQLLTTIGDKKFYLNGKEMVTKKIDSGIEVQLPKGEFNWELTATGFTPEVPQIIRTETLKSGYIVFANNPSKTSLRLEMSKDQGKSWQKVDEFKSDVCEIGKIAKAEKVHIRLIAVSGKKESEPSSQYPIYVEKEKPHFPEGLSLKLQTNKVALTWGNVLGACKYKLYRRKKGEKTFQMIFEGFKNQFEDVNCNGVVPAFALPGRLDNLEQDRSKVAIYEYAVSTLNGLGEGAMSPIENTDPASWSNWYPNTTLKFKRTSSFWLMPYVNENMVPEKYYPE